MASLGVLVGDLSAVLGLPESTVAAYAKRLRESGLISSSGRGTSAAAMNVRDATNLLCALICSPSIADAPARTQQALNLSFVGSRPTTMSSLWKARRGKTKEIYFRSPLDAHPPFVFEDGLATLIKSAAHEGDPEAKGRGEYTDFWNGEAVQVTFALPAPIAVISSIERQGVIRRHMFGNREYMEDTVSDHFDVLDWEARISEAEFTQARRVGTRVFIAVASSLRKPVR